MLKKILSTLMASLMLTAALASCASGDNGDDTVAQTQAGTQNNEETRETLDIPDTRYDGTEFCLLVRGGSGAWSTTEVFSDSKTANSDNISYAVFERNDRISQTYGVTITEYRSEIGNHYTDITNEVSAPTGDFTAIVSDVSSSSGFATSGFLWNLTSDAIQYLDFSKPWWDTKMAEGMSIDNRLYFVTGDIMTLDNDATFAIMFNKLLASESRLPNLYELVDNGQWTMDKLYEYEQTSVRDLDGDGVLDYDTDVSGFAYTQDNPSALLFAGGITLSQKDEDDIPYYELNIERTQEVIEKCQKLLSKNFTISMNETGLNDVEESGKKCFGEDHALFFGECLQCVTRVRGYDVDFGILPFPKFNTDQDRYYSMMHSTASTVSIPKSVSEADLPMVESMLEAMAYHSVDTITKQYYEINLKTKGAKDVESGPMIDTILANRACDLVYYYGWGGGAFGNIANCMLPSTTTSVSSEAKKSEKLIDSNVRSFLRKIEKFE